MLKQLSDLKPGESGTVHKEEIIARRASDHILFSTSFFKRKWLCATN